MPANPVAPGSELTISASLLEDLSVPLVLIGPDSGLVWANARGRGLCPPRLVPSLLAGAAGRLSLRVVGRLADGSSLCELVDDQLRGHQDEELRRIQKTASFARIAPGLGHDLKNRLTGVVGNLSLALLMLEEGRGGPDVADAVRDAERAALEADALVQRFMLFAHNDNPGRQPVDLERVVRDAAGLVLGDAVRRLRVVRLDPARPAEGNPGQLQQVFQNIVQNAAEAWEGGGVMVELDNARFSEAEAAAPPPDGSVRAGVPAAGDYAVVRVRDEGPGIMARDLPRVFEPFFTRKPERQGLGLTVAESVVRGHGGFIQIDSQAGRGSVVAVFLPLRPAADEAAARPVRAARPVKLLVMDDEELVRDVWERMLDRLGHRCSFAADGGEAIFLYQTAQYSDHPFDLVVLDMMVGTGMGAIETLERLKILDPRVRAVVSSGFTQDPLMLRAQEFGFRAALPKPFSLAQLERLIQDLAD